MDGFGVLFLVCGVLYLICKWLLPEFLTWLIKRKFHIEIRIGRIGFFYFTLRDVFISKNGFNVHIDKIGFRSSFLSSEVAKLLSVVVHDVRINKDVKSRKTDAPPKPWKPPPSFHDQKIPPIVITFAQFMAVDVHSVTGVFLRAQSPEWLCHVTLSDLHIDGSVLHNCRSLLVNVTVGSSSAKLLRHVPSSPTTAEACLAELSVALTAEATLVAQGPLSIEKVYVGLEHTKAVINDGFYSFAQERHKTSSTSTKPDIALIVQRVAPIIPKTIIVKLEDALLQDLATLHSLRLSTRFIPAVAPQTWPQLSRFTLTDDPNLGVLQTLTVKLEDALLQDLATLHSLRLSTRFIPAVAPQTWPQLSRFTLTDDPNLGVLQTLTVKLEDALLQDLATLHSLRLSTRFIPAVAPQTWPQLSRFTLTDDPNLGVLQTLTVKLEDALLQDLATLHSLRLSTRFIPAVAPQTWPQLSRFTLTDDPNLGVLQTLTVKLEDALLQDLATLHSLRLSTRFIPAVAPQTWPQLSLGLEVNQLHVTDKSLSLHNLSFTTDVMEKVMSVHLSLNSLTVSYNHEHVFNWVRTRLLQPDSAQVSSQSGGWEWLSGVELRGSAELWNVAATLHLDPTAVDSVCNFNHLKVVCTCDPTANGAEGQQLTAELLVESAWCRLGHCSVADAGGGVGGKCHVWGSPAHLGVALVKLRGTPSAPLRLQGMLDHVRLEWSPPLAELLLHAHSCVKDYQGLRGPRNNTPSLPVSVQVDSTVNITNANLFFITDKKVCLVVRSDKATVDTRHAKIAVAVEGAKLMSLSPTKAQFTCLRSEEIKLACGHVKAARAEWHRSDNMWLVEFCHEFEVVWSPNLHLKVLTLLKEMKALRNALASPEENLSQVNQSSDLPPRKLQVQVKAHLRCNLICSHKHNLTFTTDDVFYTCCQNDCILETSLLKIAVDGANIFTFDGLVIKRLHDSEIVKVERANSDNFVLAWNKTWGVSIKSLKAIFPYEHNFTDAVQKEFISIVKWLKIIHRRQKSKSQPEPLPSDLVIKVQDFVFEMSDDPFEVKLRDNYELLEDEYKESLKREKMLDAKIAQLCKDRLLLPAGKVEELYSNLNKLNSQIYVQRSRQMKQSGTRTRLFAWTLSDVEILALADPSIHGPDNVVRVMREIDCDTPWPEEGVEFTTLWCRSVTASCTEWKFQLRDFPQPWLDVGQLHMWGRLVGAEQAPGRRAKREVVIELGEPWGQVEVERSMTSLKFYHDLNCEVEHFSYAFGPCWEPVIAQCNLSFEKISRPSLDPSPPLSFWDKMRLLIHGQLTMEIRQLTVLLHASLDPYNTTEEMEVTWTNVVMDWTNAKVVYKGNFDIWVRTASKYDDCRLLHLPNLKLSIKLHWTCLGNPNDHHSVSPCAPDKLPEYSSNQVHDSYRAFRSQNLDVTLSLETKPVSNVDSSELDCPVALLYGSTLRWFENLKLILSGVTRPTRRGPIFKNLRPRKIPLSRHYKTIHLSLALHRFHIHYWMSFAMQRGLELTGQRISSSSEHTLTLVPIDDGLKHRPRPEWAIVYMTCELNDAEVWLKSALREETGKESISLCNPVEKCYCLSVGKVSYGREASALGGKGRGGPGEGNPTHRLVVHHLKGAWTMSNREVAFALFDSFMKTKQLKKNLSTEALKGFRKDSTTTPLKSRSRNSGGQVTPPAPPPPAAAIQATPSPMTKLQSGQAATMLQQLIAEAENKNVVFSDDMSVATREQHLQGLAASQMDDVVHKNWLIALVNSQVLLKGIETKGYVILSAAKAEILQRVHRPVWKERTLVSKTTWVGSLECMQYYATVSAGESDSLDENIMWLNVENIQEKEGTVIADLPDLPHLVGSGGSVGGVVSETVGASISGDNPPLQLQRIVSRCKCEFFYVGYGESSMDPHNLEEVPPAPAEEPSTPWERRETAVDAFTLMHHDLDVCTNSLQYAMILDIVNNLLLYVPPRRKEAYERLQRMRFQLQLHSVQDQHRPIQQLQNHVRSLVSKLRKLEKEMYLVQRALADEPGSEHLLSEMENVEAQINECKEQLQSSSDELDMMLSCYKETQLSANQKLATTRGDKPVTVVRANEICFKHAQWRLTDADGQLGIADLVLSNFLYTKNSKSDDSVEHLLELGYVRMTNLLPNEVYPEVIVPTEIQSNMPVDRKRAVRVFCREKAPVGGISVKEHFEINVVPLTIGLTKKFYNTMLKFCFPERDPENIEGDGIDESDSSSTTSKKSKASEKTSKKGKDSNFYVRIDPKDDVEKMKERAEKNKLFIYIKIPEVPMKVSYKGNKEKNIEDMQDMNLVIPTLEYHNVTWTWLDLLLAMKNDSRRVILPQAIKQKFQIKVKRGVTSEGPSPQEEDKARILFGSKLMPQESRSQKKGVFKLPN